MTDAARPAVLLIEPHDDSRAMYAEYLSLCGFDATVTDNSDIALAKARDADVIVTDIHVNGSFDGVELVRRVRQDDAEKPLVVLTAFAGNAQRKEAERAGCDLFLTKPCLPQTLVAEICRLLVASQAPGKRSTRI